MKRYVMAAMFCACVAVSPVYAAESVPAPVSSANAISAQANGGAAINTAPDGERAGQSGPDATADMSKTRAQVYQELVQSEQDGLLTRLDKTVYRGN